MALSPLAIAVWFMDDGSRSRSAIYLNTQQFRTSDQLLLLELLSSQHGIMGALNRDKVYYRIRIRTQSVSRFKTVISPFLLGDFLYKLP